MSEKDAIYYRWMEAVFSTVLADTIKQLDSGAMSADDFLEKLSSIGDKSFSRDLRDDFSPTLRKSLRIEFERLSAGLTRSLDLLRDSKASLRDVVLH